jgi:hypothetical protein
MEGFQRAQLEIDGGESFEFMFNPPSYSESKTNLWNFKPTTGKDLPDAEFGGGLPRELKMQLLLDSSLLGAGESVKDACNSLKKMMQTGGGGGGGGAAPPFVTFRWGGTEAYKSVPVKLTIQYILFHSNGDPIRALVDLELAQAEEASTASGGSTNEGQNPTTRAQRGLRVHQVRDGDSLPSIAYNAYGDATRWRTIAESNGIDNPFALRRGTQLTIPKLD